MAAGRLMFVFVMMAVVLFLGAGAMSEASVEGAPTTEVINETFTPSTTHVALNNSRLAFTEYNGTVTVRDENGTVMAADTDYDWNSSFEEGTIAAVAGGDLEGDANGTITYRFYKPSDNQQGVYTTLYYVTRSLNAFLIVPVIAMFLLGTLIWVNS